VEDVSFLEVVSGSLPHGWSVKAAGGGPWVGARVRGVRIPRAGWKLHVSATVRSAPEVLRRALPVVVAERVAFKVVVSSSALAALNEGEGGVGQSGKFLTVYPVDDEQAVRVASALEAATRGLAGPRIASEAALRPGSLVHYRYAAFTGGPNAAEPMSPDVDPFRASGVATTEGSRALAGRYVEVATLHRSVGGSVSLAADVVAGRPCILKRAYHDARVGPDGRDARDHLRHEAAVLDALVPDRRFPEPFGLVEDGGDLVLVMEHVDGRPLGSLVAGPRPVGKVVAFGRHVASALGALHRAGLAYRDLNPGNVLVGADGEVRLIDLELACELGATGEAAGVPGYASPEQLRGLPAAVSDDVYALGGVLFLLATGADPGTSDVSPPDERLSRVIDRSRHDRPSARYASMQEMDAALARLEAA
jgi:hypothetical protein